MTYLETLAQTKTKVIRWGAATDLHKYQVDELNQKILTLNEDLLNLAAAEKVLADTVEKCSAQTKTKIEVFLSLSLQQIFQNEDIKVELLQEVKRDRIETTIVLHEGDIVGPPSKISGGGVQNVLGFLLRFLAMKRMNLKPIMILDEAFRNVSANHFDTLCSFLKHLTEDHGLDILLVSHEPAFMRIAHRFYAVKKTQSQGLVVALQQVLQDTPADSTETATV